MLPDKNEVWLYVDDPDSDRPVEVAFWEFGELRKIKLRAAHYVKVTGNTKVLPKTDNPDEPRIIASFLDSRVVYREGSLIAFIERIR